MAIIRGTPRDDVLAGRPNESDDIFGLGGNDRLTAVNVDDGNDFADDLFGGPGNDILDGSTGYGIFHGGPGNDTFLSSDDTFSFARYDEEPRGIEADLRTGRVVTSTGVDTLVDVDSVVGSPFADMYRGPDNDLDPSFFGADGRDRIVGGNAFEALPAH